MILKKDNFKISCLKQGVWQINYRSVFTNTVFPIRAKKLNKKKSKRKKL